MRPRILWVLLLLGCLSTAAVTHRALARPFETPGVIPVESPIIDPPDDPIDPSPNGTTITVQTQVASDVQSEADGCPVYAEVLDGSQAEAQARRMELDPIGGKRKATRVRPKGDGKFYTTHGVRFKIDRDHSGKVLHIEVKRSDGSYGRERNVRIK